MDKTILIVGGAGYIGSHINKMLNLQGYKTIVFDNLSTGHIENIKWGTFILGDMNDSEALKLLFRNYEIDCVMHFAANAYVGESVLNPLKYYNNNVVNTLNLLKNMAKSNIKKFIFSSSCAVFGEPDIDIITEDTPKHPINPYGRTKLMVEQILQDFSVAYDLKFVALRYFNAAGADPESEIGEDHSPETHLIPLVLDVALGKRNSITVFGTDYPTNDGTCVRDYIHVNDLAEAHILAYKYLDNGGESNFFNLGIGNGYSVKEIIDTVSQVTNTQIKVIDGERRPGDPATLVAGSEKAENILKWKPQFNGIEDIISTAWQWHLKHF